MRHVVFSAQDDAPALSGTEDRGSLFYENVPAGYSFTADVTCAYVDEDEAWFRTVVTSTTSSLSFFQVGSYWSWMVVDGGESGIGEDTWQASLNVGAGPCGFDPAQFPAFALTEGNIQVQDRD